MSGFPSRSSFGARGGKPKIVSLLSLVRDLALGPGSVRSAPNADRIRDRHERSVYIRDDPFKLGSNDPQGQVWTAATALVAPGPLLAAERQSMLMMQPNPENTVKQMWERLAAGIKEIQNHNASSLSYEEHYRYAYNMVLYKSELTWPRHARMYGRADKKDGDQLYSGVKQLIVEHLDHLAATLIVPAFPRSDPYLSGATAGPSGSRASGPGSAPASGAGPSSYRATGKGSAQAVERAIEGDVFLKSVKGVWEDHTASMRKVRDILKYMVRLIHHCRRTLTADWQDTHYTHSAGVPFIVDVGLHLFLLHIIRSPRYPIHSHLMHTILSQIQLERDGETIPRSTVRECVDILLRLSTLPPSAPAAGSGGGFGGASANASRAAAMTAAAAAAGNAANTVYAVEFEPRFMQRSAEFYEDEAEEGVERGDAAGYLRNVSLDAAPS